MSARRFLTALVPRVLAGLLTAALSACGGSPSTTTPTTPSAQATVTAVAISGTASLTTPGQANQLTATATLSDGTTRNVTSSATWQSSNAVVATVSITGLVTAVAAGTTTITATAEGRSGTLAVTVSSASGDISMIAPFVSAADMGPINEAFSSTASAPWGFAHNGVDFFPNGPLKPIQAVAEGNVIMVREWQNGSNWQVNVMIGYNSTYSVEYVFEPFSARQQDGDTQMRNISVSLGQHVSQGQQIGRLHTTSSSAHLHLSTMKNGTSICPDPYFTTEARQAILTLIRMAYPNANMCY